MFFLIMISSHSPMLISFSLVGFSLFVGQLTYQLTMSLFSMSSIVLTFTSGMMILFCFCSMLLKYEANVISHLMMLVMLPSSGLFLLSLSSIGSLYFISDSLIFIYSLVLLMGLLFIVISMMSINSVIFYPLKSLFYSY